MAIEDFKPGSELVEKWVAENHTCVILWVHNSHYCAYVGVSQFSPLNGKDYADCVPITVEFQSTRRSPRGLLGILRILARNKRAQNCVPLDDLLACHGGLTYSGRLEHDGLDAWYFGFDFAHYQDRTAVNPEGKEWNKHEIKQECENLALQIRELEGELLTTI